MSGSEPGLQVKGDIFPRWQEGNHASARRSIINSVTALLSRKMDFSWGMPHNAHQAPLLEEILFRCAGSREEYANLNTLEARIQQIALPKLYQQQQRIKVEPARTFQQGASAEPPAGMDSPGGASNLNQVYSPGMVHQSNSVPGANGMQARQGSMPVFMGGHNNSRTGFDQDIGRLCGGFPAAASSQGQNSVQFGAPPRRKGPRMSNGMPIVLDRGCRDWSFYSDVPTPTHRSFMSMSGMVPVNMRQPSGPTQSKESPHGDFHSCQPFSGHVPTPVTAKSGADVKYEMSHMCPGPQIPTSVTLSSNRAHAPVVSLPISPTTPQPGPIQASPTDSGAVSGFKFPGLAHINSKQSLREAQNYLILIRHCGKCNEGDRCDLGEKCIEFKKFLYRASKCKDRNCTAECCTVLKPIFMHYTKCKDPACALCGPVNEMAKRDRLKEAYSRQMRNNGIPPGQHYMSVMPPGMPLVNGMGGMNRMNGMNGLVQDQFHGLMPTPGLPGMALQNPSMGMVPAMPVMCPDRSALKRQYSSPIGPGVMQGPGRDAAPSQLQGMVPVSQIQSQLVPVEETRPITKRRKHTHQLPSNPSIGLMQQRLMGTSLLETFGGNEIRRHVDSIRGPAWVKPNAEKKEESCCICGDGDLSFEPPVITCECCFAQVRRGGVYWELPQIVIGTRCLFCHSCVTRENKDTLTVGMKKIRKADLLRRKNDEVEAEAWVQCDRCGFWAHQLCAMFNKGQNADGMSYNCPECLIEGLKSGRRQVPGEVPKTMWPAQKLPECNLSRALESRLKSKLAEERLTRARKQRVSIRDVPTAEDITVRVANISNKSTVVQPNFLKAFKKRGFPDELPHKQKVIFLFQKIDGVDVCLFAIYTQEYGDECSLPNRKWVYLSYVDSVKYFRPEVQTVAGQALRTFVYHELLLGYFKYVKELGFCSVFIWACPPSQTGDDYILYCKPQKQKTPTPDRLRNWYMDMIQKGQSEGIIAHLSNLSDVFFNGGKEQGPGSFSATDVPYFDGDYWPGEVEKFLSSVLEDAVDENDKKTARSGGKRKMRGRGTTDELLLNSILKGQPVPQWEDFMIVHLHEPCSFCRQHIENGFKYTFKTTGDGRFENRERKFEGICLDGPVNHRSLDHFQLCQKCFNECDMMSLPPGIVRSDFTEEKVPLVPRIDDPDTDMSCEILESRHSFLSLCKGNHYQFDTLRRAKHSTMMVLYHLHNPTAPAFTSTCNSCQREMEPGCGFRCSVCSDFDMCEDCKNAGVHHEHSLLAQGQESTRQPKFGKDKCQLWLRAFAHAPMCRDNSCTLQGCMKMKKIHAHAQTCQLLALGQDCNLCTTYGVLLRKHAKQCTVENCPIHQCSEVKERYRRSKRNEHGMRVRHYMMGYNRGPQLQQIPG